MKTLFWADSAFGAFWKSWVSEEADSSTALRRMLRMMGRSYLRTYSTPGRQLELSERTCCSPWVGMAAIHQMVLPWWLGENCLAWGVTQIRRPRWTALGWILPSHLVAERLLKRWRKRKRKRKRKGCQLVEEAEEAAGRCRWWVGRVDPGQLIIMMMKQLIRNE